MISAFDLKKIASEKLNKQIDEVYPKVLAAVTEDLMAAAKNELYELEFCLGEDTELNEHIRNRLFLELTNLFYKVEIVNNYQLYLKINWSDPKYPTYNFIPYTTPFQFEEIHDRPVWQPSEIYYDGSPRITQINFPLETLPNYTD